MKTALVKILLAALLFNVIALGSLDASERMPLPFGLLQNIAEDWYELPPRERSRALENYRRFQKLPPEKQRGIEEQYNRWMQLPSEEKERIRRNYDRYRKMDSDEKEDFSRKYKKWRAKPR